MSNETNSCNSKRNNSTYLDAKRDETKSMKAPASFRVTESSSAFGKLLMVGVDSSESELETSPKISRSISARRFPAKH